MYTLYLAYREEQGKMCGLLSWIMDLWFCMLCILHIGRAGQNVWAFILDYGLMVLYALFLAYRGEQGKMCGFFLGLWTHGCVCFVSCIWGEQRKMCVFFPGLRTRLIGRRGGGVICLLENLFRLTK